ncbi:MAG TPA: ribulose-phosphate 3-epimerase [Deltaproteobacteria bacterium]|nr:ribulose-phosphate 3-epimerase [Deltaproteobacteria bacterium]HCP48011.1 ribulose-phosphate 3-epimerase [Deltaproteobacteria bacterium]|tara:strand:- start:1885 stop:2568 length:684 start_codon:yes stop_codon:yes gene_type:complete
MTSGRHLIAPSILSADFARLGEEVSSVTAAGADWIHVDVMDGHFVPVITLGPAVTKAVGRCTDLPLDVHLMIEKPERHLEAFAKAGASVLTVHQETCPHLHMTLRTIRSLGCKAGVSINPGTSLSALDPVLEHLDLVLIMTVNPGWGGQAAIPSAIRKAAELRETLTNRGIPDVLIEVDGGVKVDNIGDFASADVLVSGSGIFGASDYEAMIRSMRAALAQPGRAAS